MTAAIATFDDLVDKVADYLVVESTDVNIPVFIRLAESQFEPDLRVREMEKEIEYNVGAQDTLLPTDFLELKSITLPEQGCRVEYVSPDSLDARKSKTGNPALFTIYGERLDFHPVPDASSPVKAKMRYIARFEPLSSTYPVNAVLKNYPNIYMYGALMNAAEYIKDREAQANYSALFQSGIAMANKSNRGMVSQRVRMRPSIRIA